MLNLNFQVIIWFVFDVVLLGAGLVGAILFTRAGRARLGAAAGLGLTGCCLLVLAKVVGIGWRLADYGYDWASRSLSMGVPVVMYLLDGAAFILLISAALAGRRQPSPPSFGPGSGVAPFGPHDTPHQGGPYHLQ